MAKRPPLWGNFVFYADYDLLAFAFLYQGGLRLPAFYHGTQAAEKYLKALALSIIDPDGVTETPRTAKWIRTHDLSKLAQRCESKYSFYSKAAIKTVLQRFTEFDQLARYPWVKQEYGNGFNSTDLDVFTELIHRLRNDIPIHLDDYPLGMAVRGFHQAQPHHEANKYFLGDMTPSVAALRGFFPNVEALVRW